MTSGGGGGGNNPPDAGDNLGYERRSQDHVIVHKIGLVEMVKMVGMDREFERRLKEIERDELNRESKLDINKPSPFTGEDQNEWREFKENCENFFAAKPRIYSNDISKITFATSYMKGPAKRYYQNLMRRQ
ncbi:hypothetical protein EV360DRAFT_73512 [Lentinula raphanica]|nr:hypothetical protein EV360DRAFT_73512 [Lentinula raphanica]